MSNKKKIHHSIHLKKVDLFLFLHTVLEHFFISIFLFMNALSEAYQFLFSLPTH